jgi:thymidylate synthase
MQNTLDTQYLDLCREIINIGTIKKDRTGTGTSSLFGKTIRHSMSEGFPLITSKKVYWKGVVAELLWFLNGRTDLRYLLERNCKIWVGDAFKKHQERISSGPLAFAVFGPVCNTEEEFIHQILTNDTFSEINGDLGPIYGAAWRNWKGIDESNFFNSDDSNNDSLHHGIFFKENQTDQIQNLIDDLKYNPDSRRMIVSAWNPSKLEEMTLPPCHYSFQVYTRELTTEERNEWYFNTAYKNPAYRVEWKDFELDQQNVPKREISLIFNMRSCDVGLGLPFNLASYGLLLSILGKITNMIPDELICNIGDAHVYNNHKEGLLMQLEREGSLLPKLKIDTTTWNTSQNISDLIESMQMQDFQIEGYNPAPAIPLPLSN